MPHDDLPVLTFELLESGVDFRPFTLVVTEDMVQDFRSILVEVGVEPGSYSELVPPGFTGVLGRQSYLQEYTMPGGGVLLGQTVEFYFPFVIGSILTAQARAVKVQRRGERRLVVIETIVRQNGDVGARVEVRAGWPA